MEGRIIRVASISWRGDDNVADANCLPTQFICDYKLIRSFYINDPARFDFGGCDVAIAGGGALAAAADWLRVARTAAQGAGIPLVGWGVGGAWRRAPSASNYEELGQICDLLGVRELVSDNWVPCVSCMSPLLDEYAEATPEHDIVYYQNTRSGPLGNPDGPLLGNDCASVHDALGFLASGRRVVTSSYHGGFWAGLMGREVVFVPFNGKFYRATWPVGYATNCDEAPKVEVSTNPMFRAVCRQRSREFASKVRQLVSGWGGRELAAQS